MLRAGGIAASLWGVGLIRVGGVTTFLWTVRLVWIDGRFRLVREYQFYSFGGFTPEKVNDKVQCNSTLLLGSQRVTVQYGAGGVFGDCPFITEQVTVAVTARSCKPSVHSLAHRELHGSLRIFSTVHGQSQFFIGVGRSDQDFYVLEDCLIHS